MKFFDYLPFFKRKVIPPTPDTIFEMVREKSANKEALDYIIKTVYSKENEEFLREWTAFLAGDYYEIQCKTWSLYWEVRLAEMCGIKSGLFIEKDGKIEVLKVFKATTLQINEQP